MKYLQLAHTGACTKLKERHVNSHFTILPLLQSAHSGACTKLKIKTFYFVIYKIT